MKDNIDIIVDKIKNSRKCGIIVNTLNNTEVCEMKQEIEKRLEQSSICFYTLHRREVTMYERYPMKSVKSMIDSSKTNFMFDRTIIFLDSIQKLADINVNKDKTKSLSHLINFEDKENFLHLMDNIKPIDHVFLIIQTNLAEEKISDDFLVRFDYVEELKSIDQLIEEGKSFKDINKVFKDISER